MKNLKATLTTVSVGALVALFSLGGLSTASAQFVSDCFTDSECHSMFGPSYTCTNGRCTDSGVISDPGSPTGVCGAYQHFHYGPTVGIFDEYPGSTIVVNGGPESLNGEGDMNQLYSRACSNSACSTAFYSYAKTSAGSCGAGQCPAGWELVGSDCSGPGCGGSDWIDHRTLFYHRDTVAEGKYQVLSTGQSCDWSGGTVYELLPCNC